MVAVPTFYSEHARELFGWLDGSRTAPSEALVEGAAGTGKTRADLEHLKEYAYKFPGSKLLLCRNIRADMSETILVEWEEEVLGPGHPALRGPGRDNREKYNVGGSEVILRGFDRDSKLFSGQFHGILFNEAVELLSEEKWETLHRSTRAKLRHDGQYRFIIAETNPRDEGHWLNERASAGRMKRIRTYLKDNPRWYDHFLRQWTADGLEYIRKLSAGLSGANRLRLLKGLWSTATGAVFPEFQKGVHVIAGAYDAKAKLLHVEGWDQPVEIRWTFGAMDCGYEDSGVFGVWGVDRLGRMFELCEVYRSHWTHQDWVEQIVALSKEFGLQTMVSDHDKALIEAINRALLRNNATPFARIADKTLGLSGTKGKDARVEIMRMRLVRRELFFLAGANRHTDSRLVELRRPHSTVQELPKLRYADYVYGEDKVSDAARIDGRTPDHGVDMTLYACAYTNARTPILPAHKLPPKPGTAEAILGPAPWEQKRRRA